MVAVIDNRIKKLKKVNNIVQPINFATFFNLFYDKALANNETIDRLSSLCLLIFK